MIKLLLGLGSLIRVMIVKVNKITYNFGKKRPLLCPILRRSPDFSSHYEKFLQKRNKWILWHIRSAVKQRDSEEIIESAKMIQSKFRSFNQNRKLSIGRGLSSKNTCNDTNFMIISYLNIKTNNTRRSNEF